jgi:PD-(D/E)XK nuclease superfamily
MTKPTFTWSYSSLSLFQQCPKKYYHLRVKKDIVEPQSEQMLYGTVAHKAAEDYVRDGTPLAPHLAYMQPTLDALKNRQGEKLCEYRLGLTEALEPCEFFAKDVWWRGIADLMIMEEDETARVVDYKTGKSQYADTKQLEILSLAIFKHFPKIKTIKSGLVFIVHPAFVQAAFTKDKEEELWQYWKAETDRLGLCYKNDVWNPSRNFTCKAWCPVLDCAHNGKNR